MRCGTPIEVATSAGEARLDIGAEKHDHRGATPVPSAQRLLI